MTTAMVKTVPVEIPDMVLERLTWLVRFHDLTSSPNPSLPAGARIIGERIGMASDQIRKILDGRKTTVTAETLVAMIKGLGLIGLVDEPLYGEPWKRPSRRRAHGQ